VCDVCSVGWSHGQVTPAGGHIGWGEALVQLWEASWAEKLAIDFMQVCPRVSPRA
jgi:hypothetical protein